MQRLVGWVIKCSLFNFFLFFSFFHIPLLSSFSNFQGLSDEVDAETEEVLNEFSFLGAEDASAYKNEDWGAGRGPDEDSLGELAQLTVNNDSDITMDVTLDKEAFRKTWMAKYTLRSHFDSVRALAFHPTEPVLVTASEDHTLKLWNLQKTVSAKK